MKNPTLILLLLGLLATGCKNQSKKPEQEITPAVSNTQEKETTPKLEIIPIEHASMIMKINRQNVYVDPVGGAAPYEDKPQANLVLLTDLHGDHLDTLTLGKLTQANTKIIAPQAVNAKLEPSLQEKTTILKNGQSTKVNGLKITAVPMYNLREEAKKFHPKGRGNGYVLTSGETKIYISGDTGPIPEMRELEDIDIAFVCMNLPYTMSVNAAADAVLDFKPKKVYPYHYRGKNGMSDVEQFKNSINTNSSEIEVVQLDWYPNN